ncbi:MAG TPA: Gar1/Naf1 family protein [Candidatus Bathyarchaeia archaeon]|nr:Gar1/Naf1 family protein [Candidatus Bathyarchaeia archaeon]
MSGLRRLGKVLHMSRSGNLIIRLDQPPVPAEHSQVVDYKIKKVGVVNNVLGPVKSPYVSVKPEASNGDFAGRILYLLEEN